MQKCNHCQNQFPINALHRCLDGEDELFFCCNGCKSIYFLLKGNQGEAFYQRLQGATLAPPVAKLSDYSYYDSPEFTQKHIVIKNNLYETTFLIHNIHCQACIWLNEVMFNKLNGVIEVNINYTNHQANVIWDPARITLSEIIQTIYDLGYGVSAGELMDQKAKEEEYLFLVKIIVAVFCTMNIMWIAVAQYGGYFQGISTEYSFLLNSASFLLCTPVLFFSGSIFYKSAFKGLKVGRVGMDLLVFSGSLLTYIYSIYASFSSHETYFESVSMILTFVLVGKFLENKARKNTGIILESLSSSIPQSIRVGDQSLLPQEVQIGSVIEVLAGEKVMIDGILISQFALIDESSISGESTPITKQKGDPIYSGGINLTHNILYQTTCTFQESALNTLIELLKKAQYSKPAIQKLANAISARFSQIVLCIALLTFLAYLLYFQSPFDIALKIAISVIIIACPCALALATPIANIVGLNTAFKEGILFKEGRFLESLAKVDCVCFDKTNTLTLGKPQVIHRIDFHPYDQDLLRAFLQKNTHPIAQGVFHALTQSSSPMPSSSHTIEDFIYLPSQGVSARSDQNILLGGNLEFLREQNIPIPDLAPQAGSIFAFAINGDLQSVFFLQDAIKPRAQELIETLQDHKIQTLILSGDTQNEVNRIADAIHIQTALGELSIEGKVQAIQNLQAQGKKVAMIGDGINDSLALKCSEVGISIADKSDLAIQNSDIIILQDQMSSLIQAISIAKQTHKTIRSNIFFSILYNTLTIPLAIFGYISPAFAALSMSVSSLVVVLNSFRIKADSLTSPSTISNHKEQ